MSLLITTLSVLAISGIAFALQRNVPALQPRRAAWFCPVCIGVSMSWLWVLVGIHTERLADPRWIVVAAILVGGSAAGVAERLGQQIPERRRIPIKLAIIAVGFLIAYAAVRSWVGVVVAVAAVGIVALTLARIGRRASAPTQADHVTDELERKLEQCC